MAVVQRDRRRVHGQPVDVQPAVHDPSVVGDEGDVVELVRWAVEQGVSILPRGGGTSLAGQSVGASVHVDFSKYMNRILELNAEEGWVRVQPGVVLDELNEFLKPHGFLFGPDVSTSSRANIGGMIGNNSCGARSVIYGKTIDHVLGLKAVLADAQLVEMGPVDGATYAEKAGQAIDVGVDRSSIITGISNSQPHRQIAKHVVGFKNFSEP